MEVLDLLEKKIDSLLKKVKVLEQENERLTKELAREKEIRKQVSKRIDSLLQKMEDIEIT